MAAVVGLLGACRPDLLPPAHGRGCLPLPASTSFLPNCCSSGWCPAETMRRRQCLQITIHLRGCGSGKGELQIPAWAFVTGDGDEGGGSHSWETLLAWGPPSPQETCGVKGFYWDPQRQEPGPPAGPAHGLSVPVAPTRTCGPRSPGFAHVLFPARPLLSPGVPADVCVHTHGACVDACACSAVVFSRAF